MRISPLSGTLGALALALVVTLASSALAAPLTEPTPEPVYRDLRTDYVKTWYIYNDDQTDGILNPGDTLIDTFENWWTPVSAHTQHNYLQRSQPTSEDWSSAPLSFASYVDPLKNFWLDRRANTIEFYLTYSQFDNNGWKDGLYTDGKTGDTLEVIKDRNEERNGYAMGWLTGDITDGDKTTPTTTVEMDILIHKGQMDLPVASWGGQTSYSNPQVATSNDISHLAKDMVGATGQFHPLQFDDSGAPGTGDYSAAANATRIAANGLTDADRITIKDSAEITEWDRVHSTWPAEAVDPTKTPALIEANEDDHLGADYIYEDAFRDRSQQHEGANDGGVIAGLSGYDNYNPRDNNWGDQQVIRIDLSEATLAEGNIDQLVIWDFGASIPGAAGTQQTDPIALVFGIDRTRTVAQGQIFYDDGNAKTYFPDNRIYIAQVNIPEPASLAFCILGGFGLLMKRRRSRKA